MTTPAIVSRALHGHTATVISQRAVSRVVAALQFWQVLTHFAAFETAISKLFIDRGQYWAYKIRGQLDETGFALSQSRNAIFLHEFDFTVKRQGVGVVLCLWLCLKVIKGQSWIIIP
jgi:hypothetical protein